ncbi:MAG: peptide deformylase [Planctomycetota bacterium]
MAVDPAQLEIVHYPAEVLRRPAEPVPEVDEHVKAVARRMIQLMHLAPGVGLAAPQVGLAWRMFVANASGQEGDDRVYINPRIVQTSGGNIAREEGCLSLPGVTAEVLRPAQATISALDQEGAPFEDSADDLLARIWQHEYDHLDGVLILDRMSPIDRMANKRAVRELESKD